MSIYYDNKHEERWSSLSHDGGIPSLDLDTSLNLSIWWYLIHRNKKSKRRVQI